MKSRWLRYTNYVGHKVGHAEIYAKDYLENLKGRGRFRDIRVGGEVIFKMNLKKDSIRIWADLVFNLTQGHCSRGKTMNMAMDGKMTQEEEIFFTFCETILF